MAKKEIQLSACEVLALQSVSELHARAIADAQEIVQRAQKMAEQAREAGGKADARYEANMLVILKPKGVEKVVGAQMALGPPNPDGSVVLSIEGPEPPTGSVSEAIKEERAPDSPGSKVVPMHAKKKA